VKYTASQDAIDLVKHFEGCKLAAYICPAGILTIGVGHTADVHGGMTITQGEADAFLVEDLRGAANCLNSSVSVPLNQHEADACISFIFNLGCGAFRGSTLCKLLNAGDVDGAAAQFQRWDKARVKGELVPLAGLTARRAAETELFERSA